MYMYMTGGTGETQETNSWTGMGVWSGMKWETLETEGEVV